MSGSFLFCLSYCKGLLELMSCKQPQKPLSSVLSFPKWMCVRIPLPYPVFFSSKLVNIYQSPAGTAADPPPGWMPFFCFPLQCLGGCNLLGSGLCCAWGQISPRKIDQGFPMAFEKCSNLPLLSKSSPGFPAVPQSRSFPGISNSFTGIPVPKSFLKKPLWLPSSFQVPLH